MLGLAVEGNFPSRDGATEGTTLSEGSLGDKHQQEWRDAASSQLT